MPAREEWTPREKWTALVKGRGCPLCSAVASIELRDAEGYHVADLKSGRLRLAMDQFVKGYCVLISRQHVREPYELEPGDRAAFFEDMSRVGETLERLFDAAKMNFEILGNAVPHLHAHIKPRYFGDPAPGRPIRPSDGSLTLSVSQYEERVAVIRAAL